MLQTSCCFNITYHGRPWGRLNDLQQHAINFTIIVILTPHLLEQKPLLECITAVIVLHKWKRATNKLIKC